MKPYLFKLMADNNKAPKYDLCGVVYHFGSMSNGHYTAACLNSDTQKWYDYNDIHVTLVEQPELLVNRNAYILLY